MKQINRKTIFKGSTHNFMSLRILKPKKDYSEISTPLSANKKQKTSDLSSRIKSQESTKRHKEFEKMKLIKRMKKNKYQGRDQSVIRENNKYSMFGLKYYHLNHQDKMMNKLRFKNILPNK